MTLLTTREALADLRNRLIKEENSAYSGGSTVGLTTIDALMVVEGWLEDRAVVDAATLADDEALMRRWHALSNPGEPVNPGWDWRRASRKLRALAAALSEPVETREAAR